MNLMNILLQAAPAATGSGWSSIVMMVAIVAIFYFFMIRPQAKRQKEVRKFRESLKTGDEVVTAGGVYGKIKDIKDNIVILTIADGVNIRIDKTSVFGNVADNQQAK